MKIDLHCHTKKSKSGDAITRQVTSDLFAKKVADADVKIIAITNHNEFDKDQYLQLKSSVETYCQVWPGIELDILDDTTVRWHMVVVCNPKNVETFNIKVQQLTGGKNRDSISFTIKKVIDSLNELDVLYIPHYHKDPAIPESDLKKLYELVPEGYRIFLETSNTRTLGIFANYQYKVIIGSDVKNWNKYEQSNFAELRLPVESFEQFVLLAKRDIVNVETLLSKNSTTSVIASPYKGVHIPLLLYPEINIIFGQKGTGKSVILESLSESVQALGKTCITYRGTDRDEDFKKLLSSSNLQHTMSVFGKSSCEEEFSYIKEWHDVTPTSFQDYLSWYETKEKNKNKQLMRITNATKLPEIPDTEYLLNKNDWDNAQNIFELLKNVRYKKHLTEQEQKLLITLVKQLIDNSHKGLINEFIKIKAVQMANYSIEKIKNIADKNTDTKSFPSTTGFYEYANKRLHLKRCTDILLNLFSLEQVNKSEYLGELEDKGDIYITSVYRMLRNGSKTAEFSLGIRQLQDIFKCLQKINTSYLSTVLQSTVSEFNQLCEEAKVNSLDPFVGTSKTVTTSSGEEYKPSNGEKGILLLQKGLDADADVYLIDEPELGMGNSYIDKCIRPKLSDLAKQKKTVVVATHNANIAVRTLPYQSIFRQYKNGAYATYIGNPFTNKLVNIENKKDVLSWKEESMHTLEGGQEAFYEREHIYDSGSHQC